MKGRRWSAPAVVSLCGRGSVAIGSFYWLPEGGCAFQGLLLPKRYCAQAAVAELGKLWSRRGLVGRLTGLRVLRPSVS